MGILAYELLVGRPPFERDTREETGASIQHSEPLWPPWMTDAARDFTQRALSKVVVVVVARCACCGMWGCGHVGGAAAAPDGSCCRLSSGPCCRMQSARKRPSLSELAAHPWVQLHSECKRPSIPATALAVSNLVPLPEPAPQGVSPFGDLHRRSLHGTASSQQDPALEPPGACNLLTATSSSPVPTPESTASGAAVVAALVQPPQPLQPPPAAAAEAAAVQPNIEMPLASSQVEAVEELIGTSADPHQQPSGAAISPAAGVERRQQSEGGGSASSSGGLGRTASSLLQRLLGRRPPAAAAAASAGPAANCNSAAGLLAKEVLQQPTIKIHVRAGAGPLDPLSLVLPAADLPDRQAAKPSLASKTLRARASPPAAQQQQQQQPVLAASTPALRPASSASRDCGGLEGIGKSSKAAAFDPQPEVRCDAVRARLHAAWRKEARCLTA